MTYNQPPIIEAVFDIQFEPYSNFQIADFVEVEKSFISKYPEKRQKMQYSGGFTVEGAEVKSAEDVVEVQGLMYSSLDKKKAIQFRLDGFSQNFISNYKNWEEFVSESYSNWNIYKGYLLSRRVDLRIVRIALRFVNRILLPLTTEKFNEYIANVPEPPEGLPNHRGFFLQMELPFGNDFSVLVTQTIEGIRDGKIAFLLDIDANKTVNGDFSPEDFDILRTLKNRTFESYITDKTRTLFN